MDHETILKRTKHMLSLLNVDAQGILAELEENEQQQVKDMLRAIGSPVQHVAEVLNQNATQQPNAPTDTPTVDFAALEQQLVQSAYTFLETVQNIPKLYAELWGADETKPQEGLASGGLAGIAKAQTISEQNLHEYAHQVNNELVQANKQLGQVFDTDDTGDAPGGKPMPAQPPTTQQTS